MRNVSWLALLLMVGACDCGDGDPTPPGDECDENADCTEPASPWCVMERCVQCRDEGDCAAGQSCDGMNMCMGDPVDGGPEDDAGESDGGPDDDARVECVGAPPACCDSEAGTVDAACVDGSYMCPPDTTLGACALGALWSARFGDDIIERAEDIVVDGAGNIYVTGDFIATIDFGGGDLTAADGFDAFVASFDADGTYRWAERFGGAGFDGGTHLAVDGDDNLYVSGGVHSTSIDFGGGALTGGTNGDGFIASFTNDGTYRWARRFTSSGQNRAHAVAVSGTRVIVAGGYDGAIDLGDGAAGTAGAFVASYATDDGTYQWAQRYGSNLNTAVTGVAADASNVFLNGTTWDASIDFGGGALTGATGPDHFVASIAATDGAYRWAHRFGGTGFEFGEGIALDAESNVYITGSFESADYGEGEVTAVGDSRDIVFASFDVDGTHRWSVTFNASDTPGVEVHDGVVYLAGEFNNLDGSPVDFGGDGLTSAGLADAYLVGMSTDGTYGFSMSFGDAANQSGEGVAVDDSGIYLFVSFAGTIDFGDGVLTAMDDDIAIAKLPLP